MNATLIGAMPNPKLRRPTRTSDDRRGDIARAAVKILQAEGYAALTARKVAAEADISLGHISYHFRDMDEVLAEAYRLASGRLREATALGLGSSEKDPIAQVRAFLWAGFSSDFLRPEHLRMRIDLWSASLAHPDIADAERTLYQRYRDDLERLLVDVAGNDLTRRARVAQVSDTVMATLDGLWLDWMRRRNAKAVEHGLGTCLWIVQQLLGEQKPADGR